VNDNGCGLITVVGDAVVHFSPGPFAITSTGTLELLCVPVGRRYFVVNADGYVELGQDFDWNVDGVAEMKGNIDGQAYLDLSNPPHLHVQLDGSASLVLDKEIQFLLGSATVHYNASATAPTSDRGAGSCGDINLGGTHYRVGMGESFVPTPPLNQLQFFKQLSVFWDGCDLSPYRTLGTGGFNGLRSTASAARAFTVPA